MTNKLIAKAVSHRRKLILSSIMLSLVACGGGTAVPLPAPTTEPAPEPTPTPAPQVIRGVLDNTLASAALPSAALPSSVLESVALPSASLPSEEVAETPVDLPLTRTVDVTLERDQEVGVDPFDSPNANLGLQATGTIAVDTNVTPPSFTATVTATGLDAGDTITAVHIHDGFAGENGPVLFGLTEGAPGTFTASGTLDAAQLTDFLDGGFYFNLHTTSNPAGQVRGQIFTSDIDVVRSELQSTQEVTNDSLPEARDTSAVGYLTYSTIINDGTVTPGPILNTDNVVANVQVEGFVPFLDAPVGPVHVHGAQAGQNGPILFVLRQVIDGGTPSDVFWSTDQTRTNAPATDAQAAIVNRVGLDNGGYYINVHSEANPDGEVRGQILPMDTTAERVVIETQQEIPAVTTPSADNVGGIGYVTLNGQNFISSNVQVEGFVPALDGAPSPVHLHRGFAGDTGPIQVVLTDVTLAPFNVADIPADTFFRATAVDTDISSFSFSDYSEGRNYFNVHSVANPSGEIRGQVTPFDSEAIRAELQGAQEPQGVDAAANPDAQGVGYVTSNLVANELSLVANATVSGFTPELDSPQGPLHIHRGFAGINGGIAIGAVQGITESTADGVTTFNSPEPVLASAFNAPDAADADNFAAGGFYFNVHSAANPMGELRGQVTPADIQAVRIELEGQQEPQGVDATANPDATGVGFVTIDARNELDPSVRVNARVSGFTPELASPQGPLHLHRGFAGENGNIAVGAVQGITELAPVDGETEFVTNVAVPVSAFNEPLAPEVEIANLMNGGFYINVHSAANSAGEVRGQLTPAGVEAARAELQGQQENPVVTTPASADVAGVSFVTVNPSEGNIVAITLVEGFTPFLNAPIGPVHIHQGFAGINGPVVLPLNEVANSGFQMFRGTQEDILDDQTLDFDLFARGGYYMNVHSEANPRGELRGQYVSSNSTVIRTDLDGSQAIPESTTDASGVGYLTVTDLMNELFVSVTAVSGLESPVVEVRVGGANNALINGGVMVTENTDQSANQSLDGQPAITVLETAERPVQNLNGLLNAGAYALQATESPAAP